jgi:hypothetical protein
MKNIYRVFFALLFFAAPATGLLQAKTVDGTSLPRLELSEPPEHGGLSSYAFPSGEHELAIKFEDSAKFTKACPTGDLRKIAGRLDFDSVVLDPSKALKK